MEILTGAAIDARSAFEAMIVGKPVVCRSSNSELIRDFSPISEFAADVFVNPNIEFAIQIEVINLAGIQFAKPFSLDELQDGDSIFIIEMNERVLKGTFDSKNTALVSAVNNGLVQRNEENAVNQIRAWRKLLGLNEVDIVVNDFQPTIEEKPKRKPAPKNSQSETSNDVEKETSTPSPVASDKSDMPIYAVWKEYKDKITACETYAELKALENEVLNIGCIKEEVDQLTNRSIKNLINSNYNHIYQKELKHLTEEVKQATSPAQANSVVTQTKHWTEEQRKPLLKSISAQLVKFTTPVEESAQKKPIAMRINQADSLDQLELLRQEVITHDEIIQPKLNELISNRKNTLEGLGA